MVISFSLSVAACLLLALPAYGYHYIGCYIDTSIRDLPFFIDHGSAVSIGRCNFLCLSKGYAFFGLEAGNECRCGNSYGRYGLAPNGDCKMPCAGYNKEICGSHWRLSLYASDFGVQSYVGCFPDYHDRDLPHLIATDSYMQVQRCNSLCKEAGFRFSGLQASDQCWCGNSYGRHGGIKPETECRHYCTGDNHMFCGGPWRNSIFSTGVPLPSDTQVMSGDVRSDLSAHIRSQSSPFPSGAFCDSCGAFCDNCLLVAWQKRMIVANSRVFPANDMDSAMARYPEKVRQKVKPLQFGPSTRTIFEDFSIDIGVNLGARRSIIGMARRVNDNIELWVLTSELAAFLLPKYIVVNKSYERRGYHASEIFVIEQALLSETFKLFGERLNQI